MLCALLFVVAGWLLTWWLYICLLVEACLPWLTGGVVEVCLPLQEAAGGCKPSGHVSCVKLDLPTMAARPPLF